MLTAEDFIADPQLLKRWRSKAMVPSPSSFDGTLEELYRGYIEPNLPRPETVAYYHRLVADYCLHDDPLFIVRALSQTERGVEYRTSAGHRFKASDNAPAWWIHYLAFNDILIDKIAFPRVLDTVPTHMFDVKKRIPTTINDAGWYVAHIHLVKDGDTVYQNWNRKNLVRRFIRNIHPCNQFYVPLPKGKHYGEDPRVIAYFAHLYERRYASVWGEFLTLAQVDVSLLADARGTLPYSYHAGDKTRKSTQVAVSSTTITGGQSGTSVEPKVTYHSRRLCFKRVAIESLQPADSFRVITDFGTFQMTKVEFYEHFPNVVTSGSYKTSGVYHSKNPPAKAMRFKID